MKERVRRMTCFLLECLGNAVGFGLTGAVLFLPFGILVAVVTGDLMGLLMVPIFGGIVGIVVGIGQVFINHFSELPPGGEAEPRKLGKSLLAFYLGPLLPSWWGWVELGQKIIEKDYAKQKPGRWKRGLVGAVACMLLMGFLLGAVALTNPKPPAPGFEPFVLALLGIAGVVGGIAGALTDAR